MFMLEYFGKVIAVMATMGLVFFITEKVCNFFEQKDNGGEDKDRQNKDEQDKDRQDEDA